MSQAFVLYSKTPVARDNSWGVRASALIQLARFAARVTGSDWRPELGDVVLPVHPARPLFHDEHPFGPGEIEREASAAGLRTTHRPDLPGTPFVVLEPADRTRP